MDNWDIVFIHRGDHTFSQWAVRQACFCGYNVFVICDNPQAYSLCSAEAVEIGLFMHGANTFAKEYNHVGVNSRDYELFCYQRWFVLREFLQISKRPAVIVDSDALIYPGLLDLAISLESSYDLTDTPWFNFFKSPSSLDFYLDFVLEVNNSLALREQLSIKWAHNSTPHLSDMCLLFELGERHPNRIAPMRRMGPLIGIDDAIRDVRFHESEFNHKKIVISEQGLPLCQLKESTSNSRKDLLFTRFLLLHFQGCSKPLMEYLSTFKEREGLTSTVQNDRWEEPCVKEYIESRASKK